MAGLDPKANVTQLQRPTAAEGAGTAGLPPTGGDDHMYAMLSQRMTRIETEFGGLKRIQDMTVLSVLGVGAIVIALLIYGLTRIDQVSERVSKIPSEISADLRDISKTLAESITAAKQQPPQVILMPAPQQQAPQAPPPPPNTRR